MLWHLEQKVHLPASSGSRQEGKKPKNQKLPPSLIQSRSSVLYVLLLSYINIAEGGVGGFVVLHHTVNSYLLSW